MTADRGKCMHLVPNGPNSFYWCERPADPRSTDRTPRCTEHLTADTMSKEK